MADINVGQISEALNDKTDRDFNNMNPSVLSKETVIGWGKPDYNSAVSLGTLTLPYTCPYDGYYFLYLDKTTVALGQLFVNGTVVGYTNYTNQYDSVSVIAECSAGDIITAQNQREGGVTRCQYNPYKGV